APGQARTAAGAAGAQQGGAAAVQQQPQQPQYGTPQGNGWVQPAPAAQEAVQRYQQAAYAQPDQTPPGAVPAPGYRTTPPPGRPPRGGGGGPPWGGPGGRLPGCPP